MISRAGGRDSTFDQYRFALGDIRLLLQYVSFPQFTLEISEPSGKTRNHSTHTASDNFIQGRQQLHHLAIETAFRDNVANIGSAETTKDREDRVWVLFTWLYASQAVGRENVGSMMSKLVDELSALLWVSEGEQRTFSARTLDKKLNESLLM
jgi:hypothetical protein